jgi:hypothetical protein
MEEVRSPIAPAGTPWITAATVAMINANAVCGVLRKMSNHLGYDLFNGCVD